MSAKPRSAPPAPPPLWRRSAAFALMVLSLPAAVTWAFNPVGLIVLVTTTPLLIAAIRGRRIRPGVRHLCWVVYAITVAAALFMAAGLLLLYNDQVTVAHVTIVVSSALYLFTIAVMWALLHPVR